MSNILNVTIKSFMSYLCQFKLKNAGGHETIEVIDLHRFVSLSLQQRRINEKLLSTYKLTDPDGYLTTLDFDGRQEDTFDFFFEWQKVNQTR
jgi:hypothetical protein